MNFNDKDIIDVFDDIKSLYDKGINYIKDNQFKFTNNDYKNIIILWCVLNKRRFLRLNNIESTLFKLYLSTSIIDFSDNYELYATIKYVNRHIEPTKEISDIPDKIIKIMTTCNEPDLLESIERIQKLDKSLMIKATDTKYDSDKKIYDEHIKNNLIFPKEFIILYMLANIKYSGSDYTNNLKRYILNNIILFSKYCIFNNDDIIVNKKIISNVDRIIKLCKILEIKLL